jgi:hypothetical protein
MIEIINAYNTFLFDNGMKNKKYHNISQIQ